MVVLCPLLLLLHLLLLLLLFLQFSVTAHILGRVAIRDAFEQRGGAA